MQCRFCKSELNDVFIDLINSPASNSFLTTEQLNEPEIYFPLKVYTCSHCFLVQIAEYKKSNQIFDDGYVYFSSYSTSWLAHARRYTEKMIERFKISQESQVIEIASNDGYLLQYFKEKNVPVLGIEPTANTAEVARKKGIESITEFFGAELATRLASQGKKADLLLGNNVLAHVPDIVDFVGGMKLLLKDDGVITMEFPHLVQLIDNNQFDTIYHEHFSYLSFFTVQQIFSSQGLELFDVEELTTHGGSLRIYAKHQEDLSKPLSRNVGLMLEKEMAKGINNLAYYEHFQKKALQVKLGFTRFLSQQKLHDKKIAGYGAAAKGNTLLNYCGTTNDQIDYVVDANPHKQNKWLPGSHIHVVDEAYMKEHKPDFIIIFPWNLKDEIMKQLDYTSEWGAKFVVPIPELQIFGQSVVHA
jgi:SAM-dependent methyltransferase